MILLTFIIWYSWERLLNMLNQTLISYIPNSPMKVLIIGGKRACWGLGTGKKKWAGVGPGGGTRVHHGRVGSAGLCDLKILHICGGDWKRGSKFYNDPPNARKGVNILHQYEKSEKKGVKNLQLYKKIRVKILQVWKWGSKFYMLKNRGQNSTMLEKKGVNILHPTPKVDVKILHRLKKGGQKGRAYPLPKI